MAAASAAFLRPGCTTTVRRIPALSCLRFDVDKSDLLNLEYRIQTARSPIKLL